MRLIPIIMLILLPAIALAQIAGPMAGPSFDHRFPFAGGLIGSTPPPAGCAGVIDLSVGCALPMLGGIP